MEPRLELLVQRDGTVISHCNRTALRPLSTPMFLKSHSSPTKQVVTCRCSTHADFSAAIHGLRGIVAEIVDDLLQLPVNPVSLLQRRASRWSAEHLACLAHGNAIALHDRRGVLEDCDRSLRAGRCQWLVALVSPCAPIHEVHSAIVSALQLDGASDCVGFVGTKCRL